MKAKFKENWKLIALTMAAVLALGYAVYYVNFIHIPALKAQRAEEVRLRQEAELAQQEAEKEPVVYDYTITPVVQPEVVPEPEEVPTETEPEGEAVNMASGGSTEDITDGTGVYTGDHPEASTPPVSEPAQPSEPEEVPSEPISPPTNTNSSAPESGDTRVVDGQTQIYIPYFGWVATSPGESIPIEGDGEIGEVCPNANFG